LLGNVSGDECAHLEERLFADNEFFEQLLMEEDELIDDYLQGMLSWREKKRFEKIFLVLSERREKLEFARMLRQYITPPESDGKPQRSRAWPFDLWSLITMRKAPLAAVAVLFLFAISVTWFAARAILIPQDSAREKPAEAQAERDASQRKLEAQQSEQRRIEQSLTQSQAPSRPEQTPHSGSRIERKNQAPSPMISFQLPLIQVKSVGAPISSFDLPKETGTVRLQLDLEDDGFTLYQAVLRSGEQQTVKTWQNVRPTLEKRVRRLRLDLPATSFHEGTYLLRLQGIEPGAAPTEMGEWMFKVIPK
jgi:hypothetical protein